jgi:hypothetical protein
MTHDEPPAAPDDAPRAPEGAVLNGRWELRRLIARGPAGDLFDGLNAETDERAAIWVLAASLAGDPDAAGRVRAATRAMAGDAAGRWRETGTDAARGVTYVVSALGRGREASDLTDAMDDLAMALCRLLGAPPPAEPGAPSPALLAWLQDRRLAAARIGDAPLGGARSRRPPDAAAPLLPMASAPAPVASGPPQAWPTPLSAAPPPRRRGPHPALWGSAAALGVLAVGSTVLMQSGGPRPLTSPRPIVGAPAPGNDISAMPNPGPTATPSAPLQALTGSWAAGGGCEQALRLTAEDGRLVVRHPDGALDTNEIERVDTLKGGVTVSTPAGLVTYRADGDTLVVVSASGRPSIFSRCQDAAANAAANVAGEATLIAMAMAGAGPPAPQPPAIRDEVDVSAFAPKELRAGDAVLVQVYLHLVDQAEAAAERARAADAEAAPRGQTTLGLELARGTRVDIMLDAGGLGLEEPIQPVIWRGRPCAAQFAVQAGADAKPGQRVLTARMLVDGVPLGRLAFTLNVAPAEATAMAHPELTGDFARRYARAFLSYSSLDRPEVLKTAQTLSATGIGYFQDILSIEPGSEWRARLFAEIDRCDLFLLFWSSHAAGSDWVRQEAEYALARRHGSSEASPDIRPIILEGPPIPPPPASLAELHFNDMLRYVVVASELEARARRAPDAGA